MQRSLSADNIKKMYWELALKLHPEKNPENRGVAEKKSEKWPDHTKSYLVQKKSATILQKQVNVENLKEVKEVKLTIHTKI